MPCTQCKKMLRRCNSDDMNLECKSNFHVYHQTHTYCDSCRRWVRDDVRPEHAEIRHKWKTYCEECHRWEIPESIHEKHVDDQSRYNASDKPRALGEQLPYPSYDEHIKFHDEIEPCKYCNPMALRDYTQNKGRDATLKI
jgi:hypothetical protein